MHLPFISPEVHDWATTSSIGTRIKNRKRLSRDCSKTLSQNPTTSGMKHTSSTSSPLVQKKPRLDSDTNPENNVTITTPSDRSPKPPFGCGCGKCTFFSFIASGCPTPIQSPSSFPYLDLSGLTSEQQHDLSGRFQFESHEIMMQFRKLVSATIKSLIRQCISSDELWTHVSYLRACDPVFKTKKLEVPFATKPISVDTIEKIFQVLEDYFSFFNFDVIDLIIEVLGTKEDKARLQTYKKKFSDYAKRRIFEHPSVRDTDQANIFLKLDSHYDDYTDAEIERFCHKLNKILNLKTFCHYVK